LESWGETAGGVASASSIDFNLVILTARPLAAKTKIGQNRAVEKSIVFFPPINRRRR
jgi:hypothetical protein